MRAAAGAPSTTTPPLLPVSPHVQMHDRKLLLEDRKLLLEVREMMLDLTHLGGHAKGPAAAASGGAAPSAPAPAAADWQDDLLSA